MVASLDYETQPLLADKQPLRRRHCYCRFCEHKTPVNCKYLLHHSIRWLQDTLVADNLSSHSYSTFMLCHLANLLKHVMKMKAWVFFKEGGQSAMSSTSMCIKCRLPISVFLKTLIHLFLTFSLFCLPSSCHRSIVCVSPCFSIPCLLILQHSLLLRFCKWLLLNVCYYQLNVSMKMLLMKQGRAQNAAQSITDMFRWTRCNWVSLKNATSPENRRCAYLTLTRNSTQL